MPNSERILFVFGIAILLFISLFSRNQMKKEQKELVYNLKSINVSNNYIRRFEVASNGINLKNETKLISDRNDTITLYQLVRNNVVLFLKLPESECSICVDSILQCLDEEFGTNKVNVAILGNDNNLRSLTLNYKNNPYLNNLYFSTELDSAIPAITEGLTSFFLINGDLSTKHYFIPDRNNTQQTRWYLEFIHNHYFRP